MFCKYCGSQLPDDASVCNVCGKETEEKPQVKQESAKPQKKKIKPGKLALAITAGVLMLAILVTLILASFNGGLVPRENNVFYKDSYTAADWWVKLHSKSVVATMGEHKLTNQQLQVFYWMQVYEFISANSSNLSYYGLDVSLPLDQQVYGTSNGMTWQQLFLEDALACWQRYTALADKAEKADFKLDEGYQTYLSELKGNMEKSALEGGYATLDEMIQHDMGAGATFDDYADYLYKYYMGNLYFQSQLDKLDATQEELEAFFKENEDILAEDYEVTKTSGNVVDVRHILIRPTGGTLSEDGTSTTYSEAEWEACRVKAQEILDTWLKGEKTEESFGELAKEHSSDNSAEAGGLIQEIRKGQMVAEFEDWCMDESRKTGDYGLVKTTFGYHIMYYVDGEEGWVFYCKAGVMSKKSNEMLAALEKEYPDEVKFRKIVMGNVQLEK